MERYASGQSHSQAVASNFLPVLVMFTVMKPLKSIIQTLLQVQATIAAFLAAGLLVHTLLSIISRMHCLSSPASPITLTSLPLLLIFFRLHRRRRVYLLGYSCFKPLPDRKCTFEASMQFVRRSGLVSSESEDFMQRIFSKSGLGDETYGPPFIFDPNNGIARAKLESAVEEAREGIVGAVDSLFLKTQEEARVRARCHHRKHQLKLFSNRYFGNNRSMLVANCIFRVGCAAVLVTNDPSRRGSAKMELLHSVRTHHGSDDQAYRAAFQKEDEKGNTGVSLTKDLVPVAGANLRRHIEILGPRVLPLRQLFLYCCSAPLGMAICIFLCTVFWYVKREEVWAKAGCKGRDRERGDTRGYKHVEMNSAIPRRSESSFMHWGFEWLNEEGETQRTGNGNPCSICWRH
ncbi:hypothetical protein SAY87_011474 [Trapa incisa]|uniref:FAE domain-containing protein n=1 Tax=Trapa incisa TaxID=236973 RepID=A0AAN7JIT5_9MYRT|nr:hypothetical protein SAY87_011474 [Trapa incisa]